MQSFKVGKARSERVRNSIMIDFKKSPMRYAESNNLQKSLLVQGIRYTLIRAQKKSEMLEAGLICNNKNRSKE